MSRFAPKLSTWSSLFTLSSPQLRDLGIEPARSRRYLLRWREKFRKGEYGIGGDLTHVGSAEDGALVGEVRIVQVPREDGMTYGASATLAPGMRRVVVNVPVGLSLGDEGKAVGEGNGGKVAGVRIRDGHTIVGSHFEPVKGSGGLAARIRVKEGLWAHRRGKKVDGGERRQAEGRAMMRVLTGRLL